MSGSEATQGIDERDACAFELLAATEALFSVIAEGQEVELWSTLLARRNEAFAALERVCAERSEGELLSPAARACLDRVGQLDAAILRAGSEGLVKLQQERFALADRRRAVRAHAGSERELARAVALKV